MRSIKALSLTAILVIAHLLSLQAQPESYLKAFTAGDYRVSAFPKVYHMNDGQRYVQVSDDGRKIIAYQYISDKNPQTIFSIDDIKECPFKVITGFEFDAAEQKILIQTPTTPIYRRSYTTHYYIYNIARNRVEALSEEGEQQIATFSPNGRMVAFVRENNLFIKKLDFGTEIAITKDGVKNIIINGHADWVYEEEFGQTRYFEWSPDSKLIAYVRFDETQVNQFSFQWMNDTYPVLQTYKYAKAGTQNATVSLHVYDVENRTTKAMQMGDQTDVYFPILCPTATSDAFALVKLSRDQTQLDLYSVNPRSGVATRLMGESGQTYIDYQNLTGIHFNSDNSFVIMSERDGYRHLYLFAANGLLDRQLTKGAWDVTDFYGYDATTKTVYFQAAIETPVGRQVYRADTKGNITCLDTRQGMHTATFSKNYKYAVTGFNNATTPSIYSIVSNSGKLQRVLEDHAQLQKEIAAMQLPIKEFISFQTEEGITLNGWVVKPKQMEAGRKYPLLLVQYSGPNSQEALDRWHMDYEYYLPQLGYIVACVDGRGTGARGHQFRTATYRQLGLLETNDQISAAKYFATMPYVDASRMGIWGWSYGGFISLMCLTHGDGLFKAGIAVAPVTDWALYNTAYTERFMNRPQENFAGYDAANLIEQADKLQGNLLIVHGSADDNVHAQNTYLYTEKLVEAGKPFEMHIYTNKEHSLLGAKTRYHLYSRFTQFLLKNL